MALSGRSGECTCFVGERVQGRGGRGTVNGRRGGWRSLVLLGHGSESFSLPSPRPSVRPVSRPDTSNHPLFSVFLSLSLSLSPFLGSLALPVRIFHARSSLSLRFALLRRCVPLPLVSPAPRQARRLARFEYYLYNANGPGVRLHSAAAYNPLLQSPVPTTKEREREREYTSTSTDTIRPRLRPRPCQSAKIGAVTLPCLVSACRSLARFSRFLSNDPASTLSYGLIRPACGLPRRRSRQITRLYA